MFGWKRPRQPLDQLDLLFCGGIYGRRDAVRDQREQSAKVTPFLKASRILQNLEQEVLVIAFQADNFVRSRRGFSSASPIAAT